MDPRADLTKAKNKSELHEDNELYRSIVGSIMHCLQLCRPDCMYAVSKLTKLPRYLNEPTKAHMTQAVGGHNNCWMQAGIPRAHKGQCTVNAYEHTGQTAGSYINISGNYFW